LLINNWISFDCSSVNTVLGGLEAGRLLPLPPQLFENVTGLLIPSYTYLKRITEFTNSNQFLIHEFMNTQLRKFTTKTGTFGSSKRKIRMCPIRMINEYNARVNLIGCSIPTFDVTSKDNY